MSIFLDSDAKPVLAGLTDQKLLIDLLGCSAGLSAVQENTAVKERLITVPVTVHAPLADVERIEAAARQSGMTRAAYVKGLLRVDVERLERAAAMAAATEVEVA